MVILVYAEVWVQAYGTGVTPRFGALNGVAGMWVITAGGVRVPILHPSPAAGRVSIRMRKETEMERDMIVADAGMLIRRPVAEVFEALIDPEVTTRFWFTRSSGKLEAGKRVRWEWEMYDHSVDVDVDVVEENKRVVMRWPAYQGGGHTTVEWTLTPRRNETTFVGVTNTGFTGDRGAIAKQAVEATGGFALVLAGMKALLEHGIELNLIRDRFPEGH